MSGGCIFVCSLGPTTATQMPPPSRPKPLRPVSAGDRPEWRGQKRRPNGRYANKGGFRKRVAEVYRASGQNWFYSLNNEEGPCACMHIPYIYTPDCEPCFQQGCIYNYMYKCTLIMTAQAWQMSPWAMDPWGRAGPRGHGPWAMPHGVLSVLHASNLV